MAYLIMPVYNLDKAVGLGKPNVAEDVRLVQLLLNKFATVYPGWAPPIPLMVNGIYSENLRLWILAFQMECRKGGTNTVVADGKMDPMKMDGKFDWDSDMGAQRSTLFMLNMGLHKRAREFHWNLGPNLGLRSSAAL